MRRLRPLVERFMGKVTIGELGKCWLWTASRSEEGYGFIRISSSTKKAHRVSFELFVGVIPDGMLVLHSCDNPPCVNPAHLKLGTDATNAIDKAIKFRGHKSKTGTPFGAVRNGNGWTAQCRYGGKRFFLGHYNTAEEASSVALAFKASRYLALQHGD